MRGPEHVIELFHGYNIPHTPACAAGLATLDVHRDESCSNGRASLSPNGPMRR
jgi:beta-alanine--pyruvate transaminase